jgi:hypothetical protein
VNPSRIVTLLAFVALPMAAYGSGCSSSSSTGTSGDAGSSSGFGDGGGADDGGADGGACSPVPVSNAPPYAAVKQMLNACSSAQISAFLAACAPATGYEPPSLWPPSTADCNAWQTDSTNKTCLGCLAGNPPNTGALLLNSSNQIIDENLPGCIALKDTTNGPACAMVLEPDLQCAHASCASCGDQTSFDTCRQATLGSGGPCNSEANSVKKSLCYKVGPATMSCASTQQVINVICGAGQ